VGGATGRHGVNVVRAAVMESQGVTGPVLNRVLLSVLDSVTAAQSTLDHVTADVSHTTVYEYEERTEYAKSLVGGELQA